MSSGRVPKHFQRLRPVRILWVSHLHPRGADFRPAVPGCTERPQVAGSPVSATVRTKRSRFRGGDEVGWERPSSGVLCKTEPASRPVFDSTSLPLPYLGCADGVTKDLLSRDEALGKYKTKVLFSLHPSLNPKHRPT